MEKFITSVFISFTIWVSSALLNGIMVALLAALTTDFHSHLLPGFGLVAILSLLYSIPAIFIFWIFFIANYHELKLYQVLLKTALLTSFLSGVLFCVMTGGSLSGGRLWFVLFAVAAAMISLRIHYPFIRNIVNKNKNDV